MVQAVLGARFLIVRTTFPDDFAADDTRRIEHDRAKLQECASSVLRRATKLPDTPPISSEYRERCKQLAREVAVLRTHVSRDGVSHEISAFPEPEAPARLTNQFIKLARGAALVRPKSDVTEEEIDLVHRVAHDTVPSVRMALLEIVSAGVETIDDLTHETGLSRRNIERKAEDLVLLKILAEDSGGKPYKYAPARLFTLAPAKPRPPSHDAEKWAEHMRSRLRNDPGRPDTFLALDTAKAFQLAEDGAMVAKLEAIAAAVRAEISTETAGETP